MADGTTLNADAECRVLKAVMDALRADADVQAQFGTPPRVYDDETQGPSYPYATLERHETRPANAADVAGTEHILTFAVASRFGGRAYAKEALGALRAAIERADIVPDGQLVVLAYPTYGDVFRTRDRQAFRGILRIRIITEEVI
jgi:hypothetical protein